MRNKEQEIVKAIRLTWSSLESHLDFCISPPPKKFRGYSGGKIFNKKCVREYSVILKTLSDAL